jgi:hypothetical protein
MGRHQDAEGIEFEKKIGMSRRNQSVIDRLLVIAEMTGETALCTLLKIPGINHPVLQRLLGLPVAPRMLSQPRTRRPMAAFASDAIRQLECGASLIGWSITGVTIQAKIC